MRSLLFSTTLIAFALGCGSSDTGGNTATTKPGAGGASAGGSTSATGGAGVGVGGTGGATLGGAAGTGAGGTSAGKGGGSSGTGGTGAGTGGTTSGSGGKGGQVCAGGIVCPASPAQFIQGWCASHPTNTGFECAYPGTMCNCAGDATNCHPFGACTTGGSGGGGGSSGSGGSGGSGGGGGSGSGGTPGCCVDTSMCTSGVCAGATPGTQGTCGPDIGPGECYLDTDCPTGGTCTGAVTCPCGAQCKQGNKPGTCTLPLLPGQCHDAADCTNGGIICEVPGGFLGCPTCQMGMDSCKSDLDCAGGPVAVCEVAPPQNCFCMPTLQCVPGCLDSTQCAVGEQCEPSHHCSIIVCSTNAECPTNFDCNGPGKDPHCQRRACKSDAQCQGYCVDGQCYDQPGDCVTPPP